MLAASMAGASARRDEAPRSFWSETSRMLASGGPAPPPGPAPSQVFGFGYAFGDDMVLQQAPSQAAVYGCAKANRVCEQRLV